MTITQNCKASNKVSNETINAFIKTPNNTINLGAGNIVPHWWYKAFKAESGKPDLVTITILWFLYRKSEGNEFNEGYNYFERKFEFTRAQLQEATLRVHAVEIVTRSFRTIVVQGRNFPNELHLKINLTKLSALKEKYIPNKNNEESLSDIDKEEFFYAEVLGNSPDNTSENSLEHINNREISLRKNRSSESSFFKNSFSSEDQGKNYLASFYPLSQSDIDLMQKISRRDFSLTAVNEILLKLSKNYPQHSFPTKRAFISYMRKVLVYEMRDAVKISSPNFKLNCNKDKQEMEYHRYLEKVETSRDVSLPAQLRRKLAGVFEDKLAYELLKAANIKDIPAYSISSQNSNSTFTIELFHDLNLSANQPQMILGQVRAVYGNHINKVDMVISKKLKNVKSATSVGGISTILPTNDAGVWDKIRALLISYLGEDGVAIDNHWFSKLEPQINKVNKSITLHAPSSFIKDWIQDKYSALIEKICKEQNYNLIGFSC